jgi:hypothetical protein
MRFMTPKVWTAQELEAMSPEQQDAAFEASIVRDLSQVPPAFLANIRANAADVIARNEAPNKT